MNDVLVYDDQATPTADTSDDQLLIANGAFGIQKTKLSNLIGAAANGALTVDGPQLWTLKYASENPNGGPLSLKMHKDPVSGKNKLYAALGFLGIGIYDPATLAAREGAYNLYADCNYVGAGGKQEDWFGYPKRKIACPDASLNAAANLVPMGVDADGMPTYLQAANELGNKNSLTWYPWAEFDRYGKYYYNARTMDLVDYARQASRLARPRPWPISPIRWAAWWRWTSPTRRQPKYEGYVPAAPAHGPDEPPINVDKKGILSHFGSGMLKEAGVMDVRVVPDPDAGAGKMRAYLHRPLCGSGGGQRCASAGHPVEEHGRSVRQQQDQRRRRAARLLARL